MAIENQMSNDILSDSMSVIKKLSDNRFKAYENEFILSIKKRVYEYRYSWKENIGEEKDSRKGNNSRRVVIGSIPGHTGIKGNTIADSLAKETTEDIDERIHVPYGD